jgi:hypothetical protein
MTLSRFLALEQRAFLGRSRRAWGNHLKEARSFFGEALDRADPARPVLILGAGAGLEIPWARAPRSIVGWDADPWSRLRTLFRHRRFPRWVFEDFTGGLLELEVTIQRAQFIPGLGHRRPPWQAGERLAGLLPSLQPQPLALAGWLEAHRPGTVILANVLGQIGCVAQRLVERSFGSFNPWEEDHPVAQRLAESLDAWTARVLNQVLETLERSGAEIWMLHDRAVVWGSGSVYLGPLCGDWAKQLVSSEILDVSDPLCGVEPGNAFPGRDRLHFDRWLWFLTQGQLHMMEALAYSANGSIGQLGAAPRTR